LRQQDLRDAGGEEAPGFGFGGQLSPASLRQAVEFRAPAKFGRRPLGDDPPASFEAIEGGVERTFLDHHRVVARASMDRAMP